ncbi:rhomboid family intramembrane serine protease [Corynebacterium sputi]|uniref:rhomboid family intramembrane serine protease n=1 Tax=Corynebacterium sputi TaxID=489915 RepID=UPI000420F1AD|nr:rhomboid family intramembrane serine protease [Corynebacterium sputi]
MTYVPQRNNPKKPALPESSDGGFRSAITVAIGFTVVTWLVYFIDTYLTGGMLTQLGGVRPWDTWGLLGIFFAPFLHGDFAHLTANTVPAAVLGGLIAFTSKKLWFQVTAIVMIVSGVLTWLLGGLGTNHIGASGLVYGWLAFLIARGIWNRSFLQLALGVVLAVFYSGLLWGVFPTQQGVSWQMHLFGAVGGVLAASILRTGRGRVAKRPRVATGVR